MRRIFDAPKKLILLATNINTKINTTTPNTTTSKTVKLILA